MIKTGLEVISPGANVPFADKEIFFGPIMEYTDQQVSLIPDFISNCGIARVFAYLMEKKIPLPMKDELIFNDISGTIRKALKKVHKENPAKTNISKTAFEIALRELI
jgi:glutamate dehydrogenase/leucine dehydrogenase